jgi:DNA helicase HerA-like ATPase
MTNVARWTLSPSATRSAETTASTALVDRLMFYCDEFQNFATPSFAVLLSEARKYRVSLCTANQLLSQVPEDTLAALFGNCGSLVSFRVGSQDAEAVSEQLTGDVDPADLVALPNYTAYVRILAEGVPQPAFSMRTLAPTKTKHGAERAEKVRRHSRHRYGRPRAQVEAEIARALA